MSETMMPQSQNEREGFESTPAGHSHNFMFDYPCGDYHCYKCDTDIHVGCNGDGGRCKVCASPQIPDGNDNSEAPRVANKEESVGGEA